MWWVRLISGVAWLLFGWIILTARDEITTVWAVAVFAGFLFLAFAVGELATALWAEGWRWLHGLFALIGFVAGVMAFAWPGQTFLTLAAIIGWYFLFTGVVRMAGALAARGEDDMWWLALIVALAEILIGFWAIGYPGRSIALLVLWVAASALSRGLIQLVAAFRLRSLHERLRTA